MPIANQCRNGNTSSEISTVAQELLGHMRAQILTARERSELWDIAFGSAPINAVHRTTLERIAGKLEGRRAVA